MIDGSLYKVGAHNFVYMLIGNDRWLRSSMDIKNVIGAIKIELRIKNEKERIQAKSA